jgi:hypothetical protein
MARRLAAALLALLLGSAVPAAPAVFVRNQGQLDSRVLYCARTAGIDLFLVEDGLLFTLHPLDPRLPPGLSHTIRIRWTGAGGHPVVEGSAPLPTRFNFLKGRTLESWHSGVPCFGEVLYRDVRPGVNVRVALDCDAILVEIESQAGEASEIGITYEGVNGIDRDSHGVVRIETDAGTLVHDPRSGRITRPEWFASSSARGNPAALRWSGFLGGSLTEYGYAVATRPSGEVLVAGTVDSPDFPATTGVAYDSLAGSNDAFVAEIDAAGDHLNWATFLGGANVDLAQAIALASSGDVILTGKTESSDFPVTPGAYDPSFNGGADAFVTKLLEDGSSVVWSSFLGASAYEIAFGLIDDGAAGVVVGGYTSSAGFPSTRGVYDETYNGGFDCFVTKLDAVGAALVWSTFLGGGNDDRVYDLARDGEGSIFMTAWTQSQDFPTTPGAFDRVYDGGGDVYVAKLASTGRSLLWSTFLGGADNERAYGVVVDSRGNPIVAGQTRSPLFPVTAGAFDPAYGGNGDGFVTKLDASGTRLLWSSFLGGGGEDRCLDLALDAGENVILSGSTASPDYPVTADGFDDSYNGNGDAFASAMRADGSALTWSSFLGGQGMDNGNALSLTTSPEIVLTGETESVDFPTTQGAFDETMNGQVDAFVTKLAITAPAGVADSVSVDLARRASIYVAPNPFADATTILIDPRVTTQGAVAIFDAAGRCVRRLAPRAAATGWLVVSWDGRDPAGHPVPPGTYFVLAVGDSSRQGSRAITRIR